MRIILLTVLLSVVPLPLIAESPEDAFRRDVEKKEARYNAAMAHGLTALPVAVQFAKQFPMSKHFISYFALDSPTVKPIWVSKAGIYGRYTLTMHVQIRINPTTNEVFSDGAPEFYFNSVDSVTQVPHGGKQIQYGLPQLRFGADEWRLFLDHGGDFSVLGLKLKTDSPVVGFDSVWEGG